MAIEGGRGQQRSPLPTNADGPASQSVVLSFYFASHLLRGMQPYRPAACMSRAWPVRPLRSRRHGTSPASQMAWAPSAATRCTKTAPARRVSMGTCCVSNRGRVFQVGRDYNFMHQDNNMCGFIRLKRRSHNNVFHAGICVWWDDQRHAPVLLQDERAFALRRVQDGGILLFSRRYDAGGKRSKMPA